MEISIVGTLVADVVKLVVVVDVLVAIELVSQIRNPSLIDRRRMKLKSYAI